MDQKDHIEDSLDLISQLKSIPQEEKKIKEVVKKQPQELQPVAKEELEQFVIDKTSKLIQDSMEMIDNMKEVVFHVPDADNVASLSDLIKASTGAIETLNKLVTQDKKSKTQLQVKTLDIQSKQVLQSSEHTHQTKLSREEILKHLVSGKDVIEADDEPKKLEE